MNRGDSEEEQKTPVPPFQIHYCEIPNKFIDKIILISHKAIEANRLEKDAAKAIIDELAKSEELENIGWGEWQCFVGKYLAASLSFDNGVIIFFTLPTQKKTILLFKS